MWVVVGHFDGDAGEELPPKKPKLLKTGMKYTFGRKGQDITIRNKRVSTSHGHFTVGNTTEEQTTDPTFVPELFIELKAVRNFHRPSDPDAQTIQPNRSFLLMNGDTVEMVSGSPVDIKWEKICCYVSPPKGKTTITMKACATLGIALLYTTNVEITHHLTSSYVLNPAMATSLISLAKFAKPEWLEKVIELGMPGKSTLEQEFTLPLLSKFRPTFSPSLAPALKTFKVWEPNEARVGFFRGHRFVFIGEKGREVSESYRELVRRGEGEYECVAVDGGKSVLHKTLAKGQGKARALVVVADEAAMKLSVGADLWQELIEEAESFELHVVSHEKILEAVAYVELTRIGPVSTPSGSVQQQEPSQSPLPDIIPNTHADEPSIPPELQQESQVLAEPEPSIPKRKVLPRRAASRASSRAPSLPPVPQPPVAEDRETLKEPESLRPRKPLVRRAGRVKLPIPGLDDLSIDLDGDSVVADTAPEPAPSVEPERPRRDVVPATPARSSRLKRRFGTTQQSKLPSGIVEEEESFVPVAEPPLKKFKALFEESDPDRLAALASSSSGGSGMGPTNPSAADTGASMTQNETGTTQYRPYRPLAGADALAEEEEEGSAPSQARMLKRKSQAVHDEDVEMVDAAPRAKRRAVAHVNAIEPEPTPAPMASQSSKKPPSAAAKPATFKSSMAKSEQQQKASAGAAPGKPDTDAEFLKAVASTKRGKKHEDTFDREFNELRISRPALDAQQQEREWAVLDDFGDDEDVRGNFMVIVELEVKARDAQQHALRQAGGRLDWEGRPNFKKFKKKETAGNRLKVELFAAHDDYGVASQDYWKSARAESQAQLPFGPEGSPAKRAVKGKGRTQAHSDDEDVASSQTRATESGASQRPAATKRTRGGKSQQSLFIESDDAMEDMSGEVFDMNVSGEEDADEPTLRSAPPKAKARRAASKRAAPVIMDDDSDDGVAFKGFGAKRRRK